MRAIRSRAAPNRMSPRSRRGAGDRRRGLDEDGRAALLARPVEQHLYLVVIPRGRRLPAEEPFVGAPLLDVRQGEALAGTGA